MNIPFFTPLIAFLNTMGGKYMDLQRTKIDGRIMVEAAQAKAKATVMVSDAKAVADWERIQAENSGTSWKDEFWTLLLAIPIPLAFFPSTRPWVFDGFQALEGAPEWYLYAVAAAISAAFGIRSGLFDKITGKATK